MRAGPRARAVPAEMMIVRDAGVGATHTPPSQYTPNRLHAQEVISLGMYLCVCVHTHTTERSILTICASDTVPYTQLYEHCPYSPCLSINLFGDTSYRLPWPSEARDTHKHTAGTHTHTHTPGAHTHTRGTHTHQGHTYTYAHSPAHAPSLSNLRALHTRAHSLLTGSRAASQQRPKQ